MATAYAVLFLDTSTMPATVKGAGIFSEPRPTIAQPHTRQADLFAIDAATYQAAAEVAWTALASDAYAWLGELIPHRRTRMVLP